MAGDITESWEKARLEEEYKKVSQSLAERLGIDDPEKLHQITLDVMGAPKSDPSRYARPGTPPSRRSAMSERVTWEAQKQREAAAKESVGALSGLMALKKDLDEQKGKSKALESEQKLSWFPEEQAAAEQFKGRGKELVEQIYSPRGDPLQHAEEQLSESLGEDVSALSRRKKRKMLKDPESYMKKKQKQKQEPASEKE